MSMLHPQLLTADSFLTECRAPCALEAIAPDVPEGAGLTREWSVGRNGFTERSSTSTRRVVRATPRFFEDIDRQLRAERGPNGEPSTNDSQVFEPIRIVDRFAVDFDNLPQLISAREDYRVMVMSATLVPGFSVIGQLSTDGAIELVQLDIDTDLDW